MAIAEALENAHYPETFPARDAALRRLGFDELLALDAGLGSHSRWPQYPNLKTVNAGRCF